MKPYKCTICNHRSETPFDHGVHSNSVHNKYVEPEVTKKHKTKSQKGNFICGKKTEE